MIVLAKGYDSEVDVVHCDICAKEIGSQETKIIFGTGSSLAMAYHKRCWRSWEEEALGEKKTLPSAREH